MFLIGKIEKNIFKKFGPFPAFGGKPTKLRPL